MPRRTVSDAAERTLNTWLDEVMKGQLPIAELPLCVSAWLHAGEAYGRATRQHEIDALEREVQRLHYLAFTTPSERREQLLARLDQGLATADEATWDRLDHDLAVMAGQQPNNDSQTLIRAAPAAGKVDHDNTPPERSRRAA